MPEPRKHHSVPQSLLRQFAAADRSQRLYVFDKEQSRVVPSSPKDAGAERDFYAIDDGSVRASWEPAFQHLDDRLAAVLRALNSSAGLKEVDAGFRRDIPVLVATQLLRTRLQRTSIADLAEQLNAAGGPLGVDRIDLSDAEVRSIHLQQLLGIDAVATELRTKDLLLLEAADASSPLWISDNPVVLHNNFPYGHGGLGSSGIEIYFPISPTRCLAFYCPSIAEMIRESLDPSHPRPSSADPLFAKLIEGIERETSVPVGSAFVAHLNELQVRQSSRFLYSRSADFSLAERILSLRPSLRRVQSRLKLGEMGSSPRLRGMPAGTFLLLERGHRHDVLPVIDRSDLRDDGSLVVRVLDEVKLSTIDTNEPFDAATLIVDGYAMNGMREVAVVREVREEEHVLVVRHADPGLNALMESIRRR